MAKAGDHDLVLLLGHHAKALTVSALRLRNEGRHCASDEITTNLFIARRMFSLKTPTQRSTFIIELCSSERFN